MISTYSGLITAIIAWAGTVEITQRAGDFITLAEAQINRRLRCREMWGVTTINLSCERAALPSDFLAVESLKGPRGKLTYITPQMMDERDHALWSPGAVWCGHRREYTIAGRELVFPCLFAPGAPPPPCEMGRMRYVRRVPPIGPENASNWLLCAHPDVYLYGALAQGFDDTAAWQAKFDAALEQVTASDTASNLDVLEMQPAFGEQRSHHRLDGRGAY